MHAMKRFVVLGLILVALLLGYTKVMARIGSGIAPISSSRTGRPT